MERIVRNGKTLENVVISGISGRFPNARTVPDLSYKLYNKVSIRSCKKTSIVYGTFNVKNIYVLRIKS